MARSADMPVMGRMSRVETGSWERFAEVPKVRSIRVDRSRSDEAPLMETSEVVIDAGALETFGEGWYRLGFVSEGRYQPVATHWFSESSREWGAGRSTVTLSGRSALYPASARSLRPGSYAAKGCDGAAEAGRLLSECVVAPVVVEGSFSLGDHLVYDLDSSRLAAAWQLVKAAGWCVQVEESGLIRVMPEPAEPALVLDAATSSTIRPGVVGEVDDVVPNAYVAIDGSESAEAVDDDPARPTSTASRGFRVEAWDTSPVRIDGEDLGAYASRKLAEAMAVKRRFTYERRYVAGVLPFDVVRGMLPRSGLSGDMRVVEQTVSIEGGGVSVSETVELEEAS